MTMQGCVSHTENHQTGRSSDRPVLIWRFCFLLLVKQASGRMAGIMCKAKLTVLGLSVSLWFASVSPLIAQTTPTTAPAVTGPATTPAVVTVDGYLAPVDPFEAKIKLKQFAGPLKVKSVVAHGASVRAGDVLVQFDTTDVDEAIVMATSDFEVAKVANAKQQIDNTLGEQNDTQAMAIANDAVADAQLALDWWTKTDSPKLLKQLELQLKNSEFSVEDQTDELDQLKKMYKSEELTNATADIVVKRAVRQLEQSKVMLDITKGDVDHRKATEFVDRQQLIERQLFSAKQGLEALKAQQELSKVERASAMLKSNVALKNAQKKLNELEEDKAAMTVNAGTDGTALFGSFDGGAWKGSKVDAIKVDDKLDPTNTFMIVVAPGKLKAIAKVDESKVLNLEAGRAVKVKPIAIDGAEIAGKTAALSPLTSADGTYPLTIDLSDVDPRLMPGMKVKVDLQESK